MGDNDEIDRLLREVDASLTGAASAPSSRGQVAPRTSSEVSTSEAASTGVGPLPKAVIAAAVCGGVVFTATFFLQWLPLIDNPVSSGLGAALGAFFTALVFGRRSSKP
jgi:hypothetical protein